MCIFQVSSLDGIHSRSGNCCILYLCILCLYPDCKNKFTTTTTAWKRDAPLCNSPISSVFEYKPIHSSLSSYYLLTFFFFHSSYLHLDLIASILYIWLSYPVAFDFVMPCFALLFYDVCRGVFMWIRIAICDAIWANCESKVKVFRNFANQK